MPFQASDAAGVYYAKFLYGYEPAKHLVQSRAEDWTTIGSIDKPVSGALLAPSREIEGTLFMQNRVTSELLAIGMTYKKLCGWIRLLTMHGLDIKKEVDVFCGAARIDEKTSLRVFKLLVELQEKLIQSEFPLGIPPKTEYLKLQQAHQPTSKSYIVVQRPDGSWPIFNYKAYGCGVIRWGNNDNFDNK